MPQPRKYANDAARAAAYRERQRRAREEELAKKGLPPAPPIPTMPSRQRWHGLIHEAVLAIETARQEMTTYHGERSDSWQQSEKGEAMQQDIDDLDGLADELAAIAAHYGPEQ